MAGFQPAVTQKTWSLTDLGFANFLAMQTLLAQQNQDLSGMRQRLNALEGAVALLLQERNQKITM